MCTRGRSRRGLDTPCPGRAIYIEPGGVFPENLSLFGGTVSHANTTHTFAEHRRKNIEREATTTQQRERALLTIFDRTTFLYRILAIFNMRRVALHGTGTLHFRSH